jgi:hypothetical protein
MTPGTVTGEPITAIETGRPPAPTVEDLRPGEPPRVGNIPWGYGHDRVTAMARDPSWIFVYWEVTDEAIERARAQLGEPGADCHLRVYDTTFRLFDGLNANWFMDVPIYRPANNHYVHVGRPGATLYVDIGVRGGDGRFAPIARSGPVESPRDSISSDTRVEWMTVSPAPAPSGPYVHRFTPRPAPPWTGAPDGHDVERITRSLVGEEWTRTEWTETAMGGRTVRWLHWTGPLRRVAWWTTGITGVQVFFEGERRVVHTTEGVRVVFGPWRVTIRRTEPAGAVRVIDEWMVHYSWLTGGGMVRVETLPIVDRIVRGYRVAQARGSEARLRVGSAASETLRIGASEWRWLGASEAWLGGASEVVTLGASELLLGGASELLTMGASELARLRSSEVLAMGASEVLMGGGSELILGESSEWRRGGASEARLGGASEWLLPSSGGRP